MTDNPAIPVILTVVRSLTLREALEASIDQPPELTLYWSLAVNAKDDQAVIAQVADLHPALIVIELDQPAYWLPKVHSDPATRRIPVIAIADDDPSRQRARDARVETTLNTQDFLAQLPGILTDKARIYNKSAELRSQCDGTPPPLVMKGLHEFNAHEYFECHETLEAAWNQEQGPVRELYRAILQVGIAYYQIQRRNYAGARKMFLRMVQWFAPLPDYCMGIDVALLHRDALAARAHLEALGPERIAEFDQSLLKPINYEGRHES